MISLRRTVLVAFAIGWIGLTCSSAMAQNSFLAVSEVASGANSRGEVAIYQQNDSSGAVMNGGAPVATITSTTNLANPMGLAFFTDTTGDGHLYIAGLGSGQIIDFNVTMNSVSTFAVGGGFSNLSGMAVSGNTLYVSAFGAGTAGSPGAVLEYTLGTSTGSISGPPVIAPGSSGTLIGPTGLAAGPGGAVYVNSSQTNQIYQVSGSTLTPQTVSGTQPSAAAGMAFSGSTLYETNFFNNFHGSGTNVGVTAYSLSGSTFTSGPETASTDYANPIVGGPAGVVLGLGAFANQLFVSDYGDGNIYQYPANFADGATAAPYLNGLTTPSYMAEFTNAGGPTFTSHAVPEPASLALLALGGAGLVARRRLGRAKAAG